MHDGDLVVVLGAGPGLGGAVATAFAEHGARVALIARDAGRLSVLADRIATATGRDAIAVPVDATDETALREALTGLRKSYGDPGVLVHNPSRAFEAPPTRTPLAELMAGVRLAAGSLLVAAQEFAPGMRAAGGGTILVTGSVASQTGSTWSASLAVQKAAVRNLALSLAAELDPDGVRVVTVTIRGTLDTPGFELDRIAAEYVRLASTPNEPWRPEVSWPG